MPTDLTTVNPVPATDRRGAILAFTSMLLLLGSEGALTLPAETDHPLTVATFYAEHRVAVIALQLVGFAAATLLAGYVLRFRSTHPAVTWSGLLTAATACLPGLVTVIAATVADPGHPARAGRWNSYGPRADDLLFVSIIVFASVIATVLTGHRLTRALAGAVALLCATRLALEAAGPPNGLLQNLGPPISFILLILTLGTMTALGRLPGDDLGVRVDEPANQDRVQELGSDQGTGALEDEGIGRQ